MMKESIVAFGFFLLSLGVIFNYDIVVNSCNNHGVNLVLSSMMLMQMEKVVVVVVLLTYVMILEVVTLMEFIAGHVFRVTP